jgi:uncharacterized protein (DUF2141 family)
MKTFSSSNNKALSVLTILFFLITNSALMAQNPLKIQIANLYSTSAKVYISVCTKTKDFPKDQKQVKGFVIEPKGKKELSITIDDLPYGQYAITTFQDMDGDEQLSTGFFGAPKEPCGFSNNFKPKFKAPTWDDCVFQYNAGTPIQSIKLIKIF